MGRGGLLSPTTYPTAIDGATVIFPSNAPAELLPGASKSDDPFATTVETPPAVETVPNAYVVALEDGSSLNGRRSTAFRSSDGLARFQRRALSKRILYHVRQEFRDQSSFYGVSVRLDNDADLSDLKSLPEVKAVWPVVVVPRPKPVGYDDLIDASPVASEYGFNTSIVRERNYKIDYNLKMAGVDQLHSRGFKGKGIKIAVLDTGVDYRHPALGGGFGAGKKIAFGRSYVDDSVGGPNDPLSTCGGSGGHGTHVAGIIASDDPVDKGFGLLGVAPEATLGMYRVFGCQGSGASDVVVKAMQDAITDGADILSLSLGSDSGWERSAPYYDDVVNAARSQGVSVIAAAGNSGTLGPYLTSAPAISNGAIAVASVNAARYPVTYTFNDTSGRSYRYAGLWPLNGTYKVYTPPDSADVAGCATKVYVNAKAAATERGWDPARTILLFQESGCAVSTRASVARQYGFNVLITWNPTTDPNPYLSGYLAAGPPYFTLFLDKEDGQALYEAALAVSEGYTLTFDDARFRSIEFTGAGQVSNYSTFGPTWELNRFKPNVAAPGHLILSTWPLLEGGYNIISGTSMATPFVTGCYALLKSALPRLTVEEMDRLFATTAVPSKYWGNNDVIHTVLQQGAGIINVWNAYNSGTRFSTNGIVVGRSADPITQQFNFTNTERRSRTFRISHNPAGLLERIPYPDIALVSYGLYGFPSKPTYATVAFNSRTEITVKAGETAVVSFTVTPPNSLPPYVIPTYSGYISLASERDVYRVPYLGVPYNLDDAQVLDRSNSTGRVSPFIFRVTDYSTVDYSGDILEYDVNGFRQIPNLVFRTAQPNDGWRLDLVAANTTYVPEYYGFDPQNQIPDLYTPDMPLVDTWGGLDSVGVLFASNSGTPSGTQFIWFGVSKDLDGNTLPDVAQGDYRWTLRVLKLGKDPADPKNWESWLSPVLRLTSGF